MINWTQAGSGALSVTGLAVVLATLSYADWLHSRQEGRWRDILARPTIVCFLSGGLLLVALGFLANAHNLLTGLPWALLALWATFEGVRSWRRYKKDEPSRRPVSDSRLSSRLIGLGLALILTALVVKTALVVQHLHSAQAQLTAIEQSLSTETLDRENPRQPDTATLRGLLRGLADDLQVVRQQTHAFLPLLQYLGWVPVYGGDLSAAPHLLTIGEDLSGAGLIVLDSLQPPAGSEPAGEMPAIVTTLLEARPRLAEAETLLKEAETAREQIVVSRLSPRLAAQVAYLDLYLPLLRSGVQLAAIAPEILGADGPRTYLIISQNEDELRPTGGFISAAGLITLERGRITQLKFDDSYAVDDLGKPYPAAPQPLRDYMLAEIWLFRDVNWSPDFPTTARAAAKLYEVGQEVHLDGVVAVDQAALRYLLESLGPVVVEPTAETVTEANVIEVIRAHWEPAPGEELTGEWWKQRKSFLGDLAEAIRRKLEGNPHSLNLPGLARAVKRALDEKHVMAYSPQPEVADFLAEHNWDGAIRQADGDYLMVVDANLGFNKASAMVTRQIDYQVTLDANGEAQAQTKVTYHHNNAGQLERCRPEMRYDPVYTQMMERCHWNYVRLYVPEGSRLEGGPSIVVPGEELLGGQPTTGNIDLWSSEGGKISFGLLFVQAPGETVTLNYLYRLPEHLSRRQGWPDGWRYDLLLQKQPGTAGDPVQVTVTLPEGASLIESQPEPTVVAGREIVYRFDLSRDRGISLRYRLMGRR